MAVLGTTIFSHVIPVVFGFFAILLIISGSLEENKPKLGLGVVLFLLACIFPYVVLSVII